jgi:hypothetical protein
LFLVAVIAGSAAACIATSSRIGATFDEPGYLARGLHFWRTGSHAPQLRFGTMPLPMDVQALPLFAWEQWSGQDLDAEGRDLAKVLPWARGVTLAFWAVLLTYAFLIARALEGAWAARLAVALIAVEPVFVAHASLATSDIAVTACLLALFFHFHRGRDSTWLYRVGLPALWFGLATLSKASALAFGPIGLFVIELERFLRSSGNDSGPERRLFQRMGDAYRWFRPWRRDLVQILACGMLLTFAYCGSDWQPQGSFARWSERLPDGAGKSIMVWLAENLCIFSNAGDAIARQISHNLRGHGVYLLGQTDPRSIWYYFPVALSMKLSLSLLLLLAAGWVLRARAMLNWPMLVAAALLIYSVQCRVQIGVRFMLPLVALACVGVAIGLSRAYQATRGPGMRILLPVTLIAALAWSGYSGWQAFPNALCFTNEMWGGTSNGFRCLSDSNYDWGQGLAELGEWQKARGEPRMDVWYFGTDSAVHDANLRLTPLHKLTNPTPQALAEALENRYLAVSATLLYGSYGVSKNPGVVESNERAIARVLRDVTPIDRTSTFFIYDIKSAGPLAWTTTGSLKDAYLQEPH